MRVPTPSAWEAAKYVLWSSHLIYFTASRKKRYSILSGWSTTPSVMEHGNENHQLWSWEVTHGGFPCYFWREFFSHVHVKFPDGVDDSFPEPSVMPPSIQAILSLNFWIRVMKGDYESNIHRMLACTGVFGQQGSWRLSERTRSAAIRRSTCSTHKSRASMASIRMCTKEVPGCNSSILPVPLAKRNNTLYKPLPV